MEAPVAHTCTMGIPPTGCLPSAQGRSPVGSRPDADPHSKAGAGAKAKPARVRRDPHALDLSRLVGVVLDGTAADRLAMQVGDEELSGRGPELMRQRGGANRRIKAALRAAVELGGVLREAVLRT